MNKSLTVECDFRIRRGAKGKKEAVAAAKRTPQVVHEKVPRIARLMALAIKFDGLVRSGQVKDNAELARLAQVSRARITQIMNLTCLSPKIQEELLFGTFAEASTRFLLRELQSLTARVDWNGQSRASCMSAIHKTQSSNCQIRLV